MPGDAPLPREGAATDLRPNGDADEGSGTILLAIDRAANRTHLLEWLTDHYGVITAQDVGIEAGLSRCDVCLVDAASFAGYREQLVAGKADAEPVFLPYLLALPDGKPGDLDDDTWSIVDDAVALPIDRAELRARLGVLLRARRYSVDLKAKNERLARFADIVSHDLRNPLTIASGFLGLAESTGGEEHFARVERAIDRMEQIIEDLLALARKGDVVGETDRAAVKDLAETAWDTVETRRATLEVELPADARVRADKSRVVEVFENLFRNAIEHAGDDATIRIGVLDDAAGFFVEDDGPGIPEPDRAEVFEYGLTTREDGTGFGLAIVRAIVEAHGWSIAIGDGRDGGARFEITADLEVPPPGDRSVSSADRIPE